MPPHSYTTTGDGKRVEISATSPAAVRSREKPRVGHVGSLCRPVYYNRLYFIVIEYTANTRNAVAGYDAQWSSRF